MTNQGVMELGHSMTAESISILPRRIAAITLEEKAPYQQEPQSHVQSPSYMPAGNQASVAWYLASYGVTSHDTLDQLAKDLRVYTD
ncbi:single stranded DNA-binding domain-containing protein [Shewanella psychropiezotolerans]|uniref:hypothetical protein n=1 Tax=Shewanella psychropiezotolerans TaxID=2593655 RepID=UPI001E42994B|nr:hypothetical protein [Shewanella psychropiezotolerans]